MSGPGPAEVIPKEAGDRSTLYAQCMSIFIFVHFRHHICFSVRLGIHWTGKLAMGAVEEAREDHWEVRLAFFILNGKSARMTSTYVSPQACLPSV